MKVIFITGVTGFVGSQIAGELIRRGWHVIGSTSSAAGLQFPTAGVERKVVLRLGQPVEPGIFGGVDVVIHCAYDLRRERMQGNVVGTEWIVRAARNAGVMHQIFISSYSAHPGAASAYGKTKFILQNRFLALGHTVVRPGLIIGPGGMFARLYRNIKHRAVVPLIGGRDRLPIVGIADFNFALANIVEAESDGLINIFNPELVTLRELLDAVRAAANSKALFVPIPPSLMLAGLRLMEMLGVSLPINSESVKALRGNQNLPGRSDLLQFIRKPLSLAEILDDANRALEVTKDHDHGLLRYYKA